MSRNYGVIFDMLKYKIYMGTNIYFVNQVIFIPSGGTHRGNFFLYDYRKFVWRAMSQKLDIVGKDGQYIKPSHLGSNRTYAWDR